MRVAARAVGPTASSSLSFLTQLGVFQNPEESATGEGLSRRPTESDVKTLAELTSSPVSHHRVPPPIPPELLAEVERKRQPPPPPATSAPKGAPRARHGCVRLKPPGGSGPPGSSDREILPQASHPGTQSDRAAGSFGEMRPAAGGDPPPGTKNGRVLTPPSRLGTAARRSAGGGRPRCPDRRRNLASGWRDRDGQVLPATGHRGEEEGRAAGARTRMDVSLFLALT